MPPTNKSKIKPPQLTLSKHVKNLLPSGDSLTAESFLPKIMSGIPRRHRSTAVLSDDLLLQIKKGLESSVGSKSKVKVKRLSGAIKPCTTKVSPVNVRQKQNLIRISEISVAESILTAENRNEKRTTEMASTQQADQGSPSNVYNLRSRPEITVSFVVPPSASKKPQRISKTQKNNSSPTSLTATPSLDLAKEESAKSVKSKKRKVSDITSFDFAPGQVSLSGMALHDRRTEKKPRISSRKLVELESDSEKLETPLKAYRKRKSAVNIEGHLQRSSKKLVSVSALSTPTASSTTGANNMNLQIRIARLEDAGDNISMLKLLGQSPEMMLLPGRKVSEKKAADMISYNSKQNEKLADFATKATSSNESTSLELLVSAIDSTPAPVLNEPSSSATGVRSGVRWDTSAVKTRLIESIIPNKRRTRSSFHSNEYDALDSIDTNAVRGNATSKFVSQFTPRSILKSNVDSISLSSAMELKAKNSPVCSILCQFLLFLGLPVAVAAAAYAYCFHEVFP